MDTVSQDVCNERHKALESYLSNDKAKLLKHDSELKSIEEAISILTAIQTRHENDIRDHEDRIRGIETKPAKRWDSITAQVIQVIIAAIAGGFIGKMF